MSQEEFEQEKEKILGQSKSSAAVDDLGSEQQINISSGYEPFGIEKNTFLAILHASQFSSFLLPILGISVPIILWFLERSKSPEVDAHGKMIVNWVFSVTIYLLGLLVFMFLAPAITLIGMVLIGFASVIFPVIAAIKAFNGELWKYPLTVNFLK